MILEGIVTTIGPDGTLNIAPMGPRVNAGMNRFLLRPFRSAQTYGNLKAHGEGVFHVTDDVLLIARAALGPLPFPPLPGEGEGGVAPGLIPAQRVSGFILQDACRYYEFQVDTIDDREERSRIEVEVVHSGRLRDFFGFNRAKHAVVEAAILATRTDFLPLEEIASEFRKLAVIVEKTGGDQEEKAFAFLQQHVSRIAKSRTAARGPLPFPPLLGEGEGGVAS
jgi:hypothetical protein